MPIAINPEHQDLPIRSAHWSNASRRSRGSARGPGDPGRQPAAVLATAAEQGLHGLHLAESVGGQGFGLLELAVSIAEFGYGAVPGPYVPSVIASALIAAHDPDAKVLAGLASGDVIAAYASELTSPQPARATLW